jgi:hypothetical protein
MRFSSKEVVSSVMQGGFFLRKKPLNGAGFV